MTDSRKLMIALMAVFLCAARPFVSVRGGDHGAYGRVVFTIGVGAPFSSMRLGDLLILTFPHAGRVPGLAQAPENILSVEGGMNQAALGLAPGMETHIWRIDRRVIVDVFAPATPPP